MRWKYLFGYYGRYKLKTFIIAALCIVSTLCSLATPALMSGIVDGGIKNGDFGMVLSFCLIMLAVAAVALFSAVWSAKVNASLANLVARDIRDDLFEKVNSFFRGIFVDRNVKPSHPRYRRRFQSAIRGRADKHRRQRAVTSYRRACRVVYRGYRTRARSVVRNTPCMPDSVFARRKDG